MIRGNDILYKVKVLYGITFAKRSRVPVAEFEHSRRMLSHARRAYIETYVCMCAHQDTAAAILTNTK